MMKIDWSGPLTAPWPNRDRFDSSWLTIVRRALGYPEERPHGRCS